MAIVAGLTAGLPGFPYWSSDIGGYFTGNPVKIPPVLPGGFRGPSVGSAGLESFDLHPVSCPGGGLEGAGRT